MNDKRILLIFLGIISILAQTILLREMLVEVNGNEIVFAVYLSLWLLLIACGSYFARFTKISEKAVFFSFSFLLFIVPLQFNFIRILASAFALVSGQIINIPAIFLLGWLILAPGCLLSGFLFPHLCNLLKNEEKPVHKGYILECLGIIIGSICFAISVWFLPQFSLLCLLSAIAFFILFLSFRRKALLIPLMLFLLILPFSNFIYKKNYSNRYSPQTLLSSQDSHYGRLDITETHGQKNYYWNGELFAADDNEMYAQQMVNFILLQHPEPAEILLVGGLLNGFIPEILEYDSVQNIDYLEMDQNIPEQAENVEKVNFIQSDPVRYIQRTTKKYDLIFLDLPDPSSLFLNRFYTQEFFRSLTKILKDSLSVVAITLSSGTNFMTTEIISLNSTIYHTFSAEFSQSILIPSNKNIYIGSSGDYISNKVPVLQQRNQLEKPWFNETVIFEKCNELRVEQVLHAIYSVPAQDNTFSDPRAYLSTILLWTHISDVRLGTIIRFFQSHLWLIFIIGFLLIFVIGVVGSILSRSGEHSININIFSISLVNFVMQLVLLNLFQMRFGYVYFVIFLFTASFMVGLITGFIGQRKIKITVPKIWLINIALILLVYFSFTIEIPVIFFFVLNICFAFLEGLMLAKLLNIKAAKANKGSTFYFLDSLGAMTGGIVICVVMIPMLGLRNSLIFLIVILAANLCIGNWKKRPFLE